MNESILERNQERLQNVLKMLVTDTRHFVGQTLAAHPKGQVYIDRLTSHHREHIKDVAAVSQARDPGAYIAVLMAGWHDVFEPLHPPIAAPFALLDKVRRIRNDGYHHNHKLADEGYIEDSLAAVEALRSALARAARQGARPVSAPNTRADSASDRRKSPPTSTTRPNAFVDSVEFANNPEPRCSVVLMVDVSGSMNGAPIKALNDGLAAFAREIKQDTVAMMRAVITIIRRDDMRPRRQRLQHRRRRRPRCERRRVGAPFQLCQTPPPAPAGSDCRPAHRRTPADTTRRRPAQKVVDR